MKRILLATAGAVAVAIVVLASIALGATGGQENTAAKSLVEIRNRVNLKQSPDHTYRGRFVLVLDGVYDDTGSTVISPNLGTAKRVDGQGQAPVSGYNNLSSSKGTLSLAFRGVSIVIQNIDPAKDGFETEYGTWRVTGGTGIYEGWKGGGRWAVVSTPNTNSIEWDGYVAD